MKKITVNFGWNPSEENFEAFVTVLLPAEKGRLHSDYINNDMYYFGSHLEPYWGYYEETPEGNFRVMRTKFDGKDLFELKERVMNEITYNREVLRTVIEKNREYSKQAEELGTITIEF